MSVPVADTELKPSKGESLFLGRRRANLKQAEAAEKYGVHVDIYREWEADRRTADQPWQRLGNIKLHEKCVILRRRAKLTQRALAEKMGCTRLWVNQMENGDAPAVRLRDYWGI